MLDIDKLREPLRHVNLINIDDGYTFYYDETNNIRRLHLTDRGLNIPEYKNFVLAGIVHRGKRRSIDFSSLKTQLELQKSVTELKLKHICKGDFLDLLNSKKLELIFKWLLDRDIFIHYLNLDVLYWSIVDIVDSILLENMEFLHHSEIKNDLYNIIKQDTALSAKLLYGYEYPNIPEEKIKNFTFDLLDLIKNQKDTLSEEKAERLIKLISRASSLDELPFITNEESNVLIGDFSKFFLYRIYAFKNSEHIFDNEDSISKKLNDLKLSVNGAPFCNFQFTDSKLEFAVQISDVIAGYLGKYFTYINRSTKYKIVVDKFQLNYQQKNNLNLLRDLIDRSDDICNGFFYSTMCNDDLEKHEFFVFT